MQDAFSGSKLERDSDARQFDGITSFISLPKHCLRVYEVCARILFLDYYLRIIFLSPCDITDTSSLYEIYMYVLLKLRGEFSNTNSHKWHSVLFK